MKKELIEYHQAQWGYWHSRIPINDPLVQPCEAFHRRAMVWLESLDQCEPPPMEPMPLDKAKRLAELGY